MFSVIYLEQRNCLNLKEVDFLLLTVNKNGDSVLCKTIKVAVAAFLPYKRIYSGELHYLKKVMEL